MESPVALKRALSGRITAEAVAEAREVVSAEIQEQAKEAAQMIVQALKGNTELIIRNSQELLNHPDARIKQKENHFQIEHLIGKPLQKSISENRNINIDMLLD